MSEFTNTRKSRIELLNRYMIGIVEGIHGAKLVEELGLKVDNFIPTDVLSAFDLLFESKTDLKEMKKASNKLFNILFESLRAYPSISPKKDSFIYYLMRDNAQVNSQLKDLKPLIKQINQKTEHRLLETLNNRFEKLAEFTKHYTVKEHILFPVLESNWKEYDCLKLMWSFHDDIRQNFKKIIALLGSENFELKTFNTLAGALFFNISTVIFREEKILFPIMMESLDSDLMEKMRTELNEMKLPFVEIRRTSHSLEKASSFSEGMIQLPTGEITLDQVELIFNHLPVDITFVDENDTVRYFSTPKHRIFPRTASIIGRKVQNCHPPESVDVVNRIVASFKKGEKDRASFWLHLGPKFVLIQYFALRDRDQNYRGVLEVSQEISEIQELRGDRKLLDW